MSLRFKRVFDLLLAAALLVVLFPALAIAIVIARIDTGAPGIYRQERIGMKERIFTIYKLRTMLPTADSSTVTTATDPRVTSFGAFLRRYKLDELPQIWNVARGDMSFVGPRPTVQDDYSRMDARHRARFQMRPGITGLAQIKGNTSLSWPQRLEWDLRYVSDWSFRLDLEILAHTTRSFLRGGLETHPTGDDEWD